MEIKKNKTPMDRVSPYIISEEVAAILKNEKLLCKIWDIFETVVDVCPNYKFFERPTELHKLQYNTA